MSKPYFCSGPNTFSACASSSGANPRKRVVPGEQKYPFQVDSDKGRTLIARLKRAKAAGWVRPAPATSDRNRSLLGLGVGVLSVFMHTILAKPIPVVVLLRRGRHCLAIACNGSFVCIPVLSMTSSSCKSLPVCFRRRDKGDSPFQKTRHRATAVGFLSRFERCAGSPPDDNGLLVNIASDACDKSLLTAF